MENSIKNINIKNRNIRLNHKENIFKNVEEHVKFA